MDRTRQRPPGFRLPHAAGSQQRSGSSALQVPPCACYAPRKPPNPGRKPFCLARKAGEACARGSRALRATPGGLRAGKKDSSARQVRLARDTLRFARNTRKLAHEAAEACAQGGGSLRARQKGLWPGLRGLRASRKALRAGRVEWLPGGRRSPQIRSARAAGSRAAPWHC